MANYLNFDASTLFPYLRLSSSFALLITERKDLNGSGPEGKVELSVGSRTCIGFCPYSSLTSGRDRKSQPSMPLTECHKAF